jgi:glycerate-2-kinase
VRAAHTIARALAASHRDDLWILLLSGGATALIAAPRGKGTLAGLKKTFKKLLNSGLPIEAMNARRKRICLLADGRLRALCPGRMLTLAISDAPTDRLDTIGSGPGLGSPSWVIASARTSLRAATRLARKQGYQVLNLGVLGGRETKLEAQRQVRMALSRVRRKPLCILSGGELPVTVRGRGRGGRNQEFVLAALDALGSLAPKREFLVLSMGTDGRDGTTPAAGACAGPAMLHRALSPAKYLARNDSYAFFKKTGGLIVTGPTGTNVMDFRVVIVAPR